jgi:hypothetical protein
LEYDYLGEQTVKNIPEPIRAYRIMSDPDTDAHSVVKVKKTVGRTWRKMFLALIAVFIVGVVGAAWYFYFRSATPLTEIAAVENMAFPLPDKPSIAVLPFANLSDDPKQDYFTDGLTDDLITDLSQISGLFIIARNSTFAYKGKSVKIKQVAEEIKALLFGRTVCGSDGCIDRTKQGQATHHVMQISESGRSWIEGDMLCNQWKTRMKGLKYCAPVFRNPEATAGMLNDYLSITDYEFTTFSTVD